MLVLSCNRIFSRNLHLSYLQISEIQSGKMKLTSKSPEAAEAIKRILSIIPFWRVLAAEDLNTQESMTFWMFCPSVCHEFVTDKGTRNAKVGQDTNASHA